MRSSPAQSSRRSRANKRAQITPSLGANHAFFRKESESYRRRSYLACSVRRPLSLGFTWLLRIDGR
eukprot:4418417-Prymnesium_polylepis.1